MKEPRNWAIKQPMKQKYRIRLPLKVRILWSNSPERDISLVKSFKFIIFNRIAIKCNKLFCIKKCFTNGQKNMLVCILVWAYDSFWISIQQFLHKIFYKIIDITEANDDVKLDPEEYHSNRADDIKWAHFINFSCFYNIITATY